jgi:uncharacterized repeat protein (TIGR04138 family)
MAMSSSPEMLLHDAVDDLRERGSRYAREAYLFVVASLGHTVQHLPAERLADPQLRHLSGQELVHGVIRFACQQFGPMAPTVFREWRVTTTEDVGRIVFDLVEADQLSARPEDTIADFLHGPDLMAALAASEQPSSTPRGNA